MAEDVKIEQQENSAETADKAAEKNTPEGKSLAPEDQTFWEDSVDANTVDISKEQTGREEKQSPTAETEEADSTSPNPDSPEGENKDQPAEQEPVAEKGPEQEETKAEEDNETAADTPPAEEQDGEEKQSPTAETEETDSTSPTPDSPEGENEDQPAEQEPVAEKGPEQEETKAEEDNAAAASDEPRGKGKVINFYEYLRKKRLLTGIGILLLIAGSIGYAVVPGLRSSGTGTSTFLGGIPDTAYDMKFFLPLDVGYEKSQFVKVTIALELMDEGLQKEIDKNISQLRKEVINLILTKSPKEVKSSSGKKELSREITSRINNYLSKDCIKGTYFTELVVL